MVSPPPGVSRRAPPLTLYDFTLRPPRVHSPPFGLSSLILNPIPAATGLVHSPFQHRRTMGAVFHPFSLTLCCPPWHVFLGWLLQYISSFPPSSASFAYVRYISLFCVCTVFTYGTSYFLYFLFLFAFYLWPLFMDWFCVFPYYDFWVGYLLFIVGPYPYWVSPESLSASGLYTPLALASTSLYTPSPHALRPRHAFFSFHLLLSLPLTPSTSHYSHRPLFIPILLFSFPYFAGLAVGRFG